MEVINAGMRKGIKTMCCVAQTAQFISLMPKPQDFVTRLVGDVVYLSAQVKKLSDNMNKLLDSYANIPTEYLNTQLNSITGSLTSITDRISTYAQNGVNQTIGVAESAGELITEVTGTVIDTTGAVINATTGLASAVAESNALIMGKKDVASNIHDSTEAIMEWTKDGFKQTKNNVTQPIKDATKKIKDAKDELNKKITGITENVNKTITAPFKPIEKLIENLKEQMKSLEKKMDSNFKGVTGMDSVSKNADKISTALKESGETNKESKAAQAITSSLADVIKNFSIGKVVFAFAGVLTQAGLVKLGLNELPPIDFESMLYKIRDDMKKTPEDLEAEYNQLNAEIDATYEELKKLGEDAVKIPKEERTYTAKNYKEFIKMYEGDLQKQRVSVRRLMQFHNENKDKKTTNDKGEEVSAYNDKKTKQLLRSAIKEVRKHRKKAKNAKQANTLKNLANEELKKFTKEVNTRCNRVKSDWNSMMAQYKKAIAEIKKYFASGGDSDKFINDCCKQINKDFNDIKANCISLMEQLGSTSVKVSVPADICMGFPNPVYKLASFWMDIKTIAKFIKDIITLIIDICNNINKLAQLMKNGINNLDEIITQLMNMIGLKWLMDMVQNIINLFGSNVEEAKNKLENSLSPVYFGDTDEYNNMMDAIDAILENEKIDPEHIECLGDVISMLEPIGTNKDKDVNKLIEKVQAVKNMGTVSESKIEELLDEVEKNEDKIVAYKSPILKKTGTESTVEELQEGEKEVDEDVKFIGWHYFHANLEHTKSTYYTSRHLRRSKSKIIRKAAKSGSKKKGGINKLNTTKVGKKSTKVDTAYVAFYWYTYYTENIEKDYFDPMTDDGITIIDSVVQTQNGSVVEITDVNGQKRKVFVADSMVRNGDYVLVDGVRYRVGPKKVEG